MEQLTPRDAVLQVLNRVEDGAWASEVLRGIRERTGTEFDARDGRFVTELAYGTLRRRLEMDHVLSQFSRYPVDDLDRPVRNILRMAVYQLMYMRVPAYAACDRAVEQTRRSGHRRAAGLVNGVLRSVVRAGDEISYPDRKSDPVRWIAVTESHPEWIVRLWLKEYGEEETLLMCRANNRPAATDVRINRLRTGRRQLRERLASEGRRARRCRWAPHGLHWESSAPPQRTEEYGAGYLSVQGEGSQLAVLATGVRPGMRVLDLCAGRGGKTAYLAELMDDEGEITAVDLHGFKLEVTQRHLERLGLHIVRTEEADARSLSGEMGRYHLVLIDAPCSGLGILGRHPDARWHRDEGILGRMPKLQREILRSAARRVADGGILVYCTCSLSAAENGEIVRWFLRDHPAFRREDLPPRFPDDLRGAEPGQAELLPHRHGTDGFFIARLRRCGEVDR